MSEEVIIVDTIPVIEDRTPLGALIINGKHLCACDNKTKRDLGPLDSEGKQYTHIYLCDNHRTIMKGDAL